MGPKKARCCGKTQEAFGAAKGTCCTTTARREAEWPGAAMVASSTTTSTHAAVSDRMLAKKFKKLCASRKAVVVGCLQTAAA
eukprot:m.88286 g.88286  ORF g.88286 m.88286 type:complete len:82 (+) comp15177_c0_seq1:1863-2108(+)